MIKDYFKIATGGFIHRKKRTWLTLLGIIIGIASVVSLLSLGFGMYESLNEQFEMMGADKIIITPGGSLFGLGAGGAKILTEDDLSSIESVSGIYSATPWLYKSARLKFNREIKYGMILATTTNPDESMLKSFSNLEIIAGRDFKLRDHNKMIIGYRISTGKFFNHGVKVGDKIEVQDRKFEVIGITSEVGNPQDDSQIYIPINDAREIFNENEKIDMIFAQVRDENKVVSVSENVERALRRSRNVKEGQEDFSVITYDQIRGTFNIIFSALIAVIIGIAAISLIVGGIGITNTMYTSVLERTKEIGIMKALGARNRAILTIFVIEAGLLGLVGGVIGIILGVFLGLLVKTVASAGGISLIRASFPAWLIIGSLLFSILIGIISGVFPAKKAAKLNPADALRYE